MVVPARSASNLLYLQQLFLKHLLYGGPDDAAPKNLSLKRISLSTVAIANSWFSSIPANLDFRDVVIPFFIVRIPMSSSCLSQDLSSTRMCGITMDSIAVSFGIAWAISSTGGRTDTSSWPSPTGLLLGVGCCCQQHTQPRPSSVSR